MRFAPILQQESPAVQQGSPPDFAQSQIRIRKWDVDGRKAQPGQRVCSPVDQREENGWRQTGDDESERGPPSHAERRSKTGHAKPHGERDRHDAKVGARQRRQRHQQSGRRAGCQAPRTGDQNPKGRHEHRRRRQLSGQVLAVLHRLHGDEQQRGKRRGSRFDAAAGNGKDRHAGRQQAKGAKQPDGEQRFAERCHGRGEHEEQHRRLQVEQLDIRQIAVEHVLGHHDKRGLVHVNDLVIKAAELRGPNCDGKDATGSPCDRVAKTPLSRAQAPPPVVVSQRSTRRHCLSAPHSPS